MDYLFDTSKFEITFTMKAIACLCTILSFYLVQRKWLAVILALVLPFLYILFSEYIHHPSQELNSEYIAFMIGGYLANILITFPIGYLFYYFILDPNWKIKKDNQSEDSDK